MTGPLLAAAAGVGFGAFQTLNRRAVGGMQDAYLATFLQLLVAMLVLLAASAATEGLDPLRDAPAAALLWFAGAGLVHFFVGWTFLNMSQMRIGASRTSPLLATNPVWGALFAAVWLGEVPGAVSWIAVALIVAGALTVTLERVEETGWGVGWKAAVPGLAAAFAWSISPIFIKQGLEDMDSPLLGLTLGMAVALVAYAVALPLRPQVEGAVLGSLDALAFKLAAGIMVGLSVWARWESLDSAGIAVVLALGLLSVPVVLFASPLLMGRHLEKVTLPVWAGAGLVVGGALLLIAVA
jgi:drug/metabolite transporter (DMT)-like permease